MSATPKKKYRSFYLSISDGDTLETVAVKTAKLITRATREGFDTARADYERVVRFICERMETQEEAEARENDLREAEWTIAKARAEMDRIALKYSLEQLEKL